MSGSESSAMKKSKTRKQKHAVPDQLLQQSRQQPPTCNRSDKTKMPQDSTPSTPPAGESQSHTNSEHCNDVTPQPLKVPSFDEDDDTWQLVTTCKPRPKRTVLFIGNIAKTTTEKTLVQFVQSRAMTTTQRDVLVHNAEIFEGKDGQSTPFAPLTVNSSDSSLLLSRTFCMAKGTTLPPMVLQETGTAERYPATAGGRGGRGAGYQAAGGATPQGCSKGTLAVP